MRCYAPDPAGELTALPDLLVGFCGGKEREKGVRKGRGEKKGRGSKSEKKGRKGEEDKREKREEEWKGKRNGRNFVQL